MQGLSADTNDEAYVSVRAWIAAWGTEIAAVDLASARRRFAADVVAFGTHADVVHGIDALEAEQWSPIWPAIEGFAFRLDELVVLASADARQAVVVVGWDSVGFSADGARFDRPGRAIVLRRDRRAAPWVGVHTHFSLARGIPATTHGAGR